MNGWTALHWAAKRNNLSCVEALLSRGADRMVYTSKGELAAHLTTNKGVLQVLGYSGQHTREKQKADKEKHRHIIEQGVIQIQYNIPKSIHFIVIMTFLFRLLVAALLPITFAIRP